MKKYISAIAFLLVLFGFNTLNAQNYEYEEIEVGHHDNEVTGVFINDADTKFATSSQDKTIKIWSLPNGEEIRTLNGHEDAVYNVSFSGDDKKLASCSADNTVRVWDVETGKEIFNLSGQFDKVIGVYFSQNDQGAYIASAGLDKTVKLWDTRLGSEVKTYKGHTEAVNNVAYSYDGKFIASCSDDKTVRIWSPSSGSDKEVMILSEHKAPVIAVLFTFDSKKLITADNEGNIFIWEMPSGKLLKQIKAHYSLIQDVSVAADNNTLVSIGFDSKVKLWDISTANNLMTHDSDVQIWSVDINSDASIIVLGCRDGSVRFLKKK